MPCVAFSRDYAAPEVLTRGVVSPQADMWSWGLVVMELLKLRVPRHPGRDAHATSLKDWVAAVGAVAQAAPCIVRRCSVAEPAERPDSFAHVAESLAMEDITIGKDSLEKWADELRNVQKPQAWSLDDAEYFHCGLAELQVLDLLWEDCQLKHFCIQYCGYAVPAKVLQSFRGRGIGRALMLQCLRWCKSEEDVQECVDAFVHVSEDLSGKELYDFLQHTYDRKIELNVSVLQVARENS